MQAVTVTTPGARPRLSAVPAPRPAPGTVLVRVAAAGLNAVDNAIAAGTLARVLPHEYPVILGRDAAGVVEALGSGVRHVAVGDAVLGHIPLAPPIRLGTLAEYAVLPATAVVAKPSTVDFVTAAALPLAGTAALAAVDAVKPRPGATVLVVGASGGVGSYTVQLLAARGVTVLATGPAGDADRLVKLGAAQVLDPTAEPVVNQVRAAHRGGVDALIDLVAREPERMPLLAVRAGGRVVSPLGAADGPVLTARHLDGVNVIARPAGNTLGPLVAQVAAGDLTVGVAQVLPLAQAPEGLAALATGTVPGKIVVAVRDLG